MRLTITLLTSLIILNSYSQEVKQEFLEVIVEGKEAYMSTTTGEVVFRKHSETDASAFISDATGTTFYIDTKIHKVKKGEVLATIAKKYKTSIERLKKDNKLKSDDLSIGKTLKINSTLAVESLKPKMVSGEGRIVARLRPGENPAMLNMPGGPPNAPSTPVKMPEHVKKTPKAKDVDVVSAVEETSEEAKVQNEKIVEEPAKPKSNEIKERVDQPVDKAPVKAIEDTKSDAKEIIEKSDSEAKLYIVKKGDTLYAIAKANNTTVESIKTKNKLTSNALFIGQKLKL